MPSRLRVSALAGGVLAVLLASPALAAVQWYEHYNRGIELEERGSWREAFEDFQAAARVVPVPAKRIQTEGGNFILDYDPYYHMALCLTGLDKPHLAVGYLRTAANARVTPRARLEALWRRVQGEIARKKEIGSPAPTPTAEPATGQLAVQSDPPGAAVTLDGTAAGTTPMGPFPVSPGSHLVRAEAPGFGPAEEHVTVTAGGTATLVLRLGRTRAARVPAAAAPQPTRTVPAPTPVPQVAGTTPMPNDRQAGGPTPPPAPTGSARSGTGPAGAHRNAARGLLLLAALAAIAAAVAWRRARRRPAVALPPAPTGPAATLEQAATLVEAGARMGRYELQSVLGRGGMATTYRARRAADGQTVAVKVPHDGCLSDATFVTRFLREGQLGEQLHHPRIVRVLDAGEEKGRPFLAMELVSGRTLKQELREHAPLPVRRALEVARDIAEALDYAHAKGVIHRDLKPENVMILPDGTVKVMDFGIARLADQPGLTTSSLFLGTPAYAAPEMIDPKTVDHRVDLYALGIILYEMLEGAVPFTADSPYRVLEMHLRQPLPPSEQLAHPIPAPVWALVQRLCEKDPAARFPSAQALLVELNRLFEGFPAVEGRDVF